MKRVSFWITLEIKRIISWKCITSNLSYIVSQIWPSVASGNHDVQWSILWLHNAHTMTQINQMGQFMSSADVCLLITVTEGSLFFLNPGWIVVIKWLMTVKKNEKNYTPKSQVSTTSHKLETISLQSWQNFSCPSTQEWRLRFLKTEQHNNGFQCKDLKTTPTLSPCKRKNATFWKRACALRL